MKSQLDETARLLEQVLAELDAANLPIAAAHVSTAVELLKSETRRRRPVRRPSLRVVS